MTRLSRLKNNLYFLTQIAFTFAITASLTFFSPYLKASSNSENLNPKIDFEAINPRALEAMGFEEGQVQFLQTESTVNGKKVAIDVVRGELQTDQTKNLTSLLQYLEPQIRKAYDVNPEVRFQFNYITADGNNTLDIHAEELLGVINEIDPRTKTYEEKINSSVASKLKGILSKTFSSQTYINSAQRAFDKTTKSDVMWSLMRFTFAGGASTFSFTLSDIPLPTALALGISLGAGSGGVGLFIEKFTGWLDNNKTIPGRKLNYVASKETLMFLSPLLIGFQGTGLATPEGATLLVGAATATVVVQNVYHQIKKRSPHAAMWYKWYAVEALFLSMPYLMMPMWDIYTKSTVETMTSTFLFALYSTASQGIWDIFITKLRKPHLEAAIKKDLAEMAERLKGVDTTNMTPREIDAITKREEFKVREPYKKYFFAASFVSVTSAIAGNTGAYMQIHGLEMFGKAGLFVLGLGGVTSWIVYKLKNKSKNKGSTANLLNPEIAPATGPSCSRLFSM